MSYFKEIEILGEVDTGNSTTTPLGGGATFTGTSKEILNAGTVFINVYADVVSADDGLDIQQSSDGTNWDHHDLYTLPAGGTKNYSINPHSKYLKVVYTNGAGAQSAFRLQTIIKGNAKPSSHRIQDSIVDEDDAELVKAVVSAMKTDGAFTNVKADNFDNLRICLQRFSTTVASNSATQLNTTLFNSSGNELDISSYGGALSRDFLIEVQKGNVPGHSIVHKYGTNAAVANNVWEVISQLSRTAAASNWRQSAVTMRVKAGGNAADASGGAGARQVTLVGIDNNLIEVEETLTMNANGTLASSASTALFWRVYRAFLPDGGVGAYGVANTGIITIEDSGGALDENLILAGVGQTQHCGYTVPTGKTGYLLSTHITVDAGKAADIRLMTRNNFNDVSTPFSPIRVRKYWDGVLGDQHYEPRAPEMIFSALTDIWMEAEGSGAQTEVSADFEILLVDD